MTDHRDGAPYLLEVRSAFSSPPRGLGAVQLIWTDPPTWAKSPERLRMLRENWRSLLEPDGVVIALELGDGSDRSLTQITADILRMTDVGDLVVDPFCGTGTTGVAALAQGRGFYGCDIDGMMVRRASERLAGAPPRPGEARP